MAGDTRTAVPSVKVEPSRPFAQRGFAAIRPARVEAEAAPPFSWRRNLLAIALGLGFIGGWLFSALPIAIVSYTRGGIELPEPSEIQMTIATFLLLTGVVIIAIGLSEILQKLIGVEEAHH